MKLLKIISLSLLITFFSCKEDKPIENANSNPNISTFYLIRHAEKDRSNPEDADPELNQKGLGRAMHWAEIFNEVDLDAIYSTNFNRTSMTAAPTSVKKNIDVQYYDPRIMDIEEFKMENLNKNVLVVGHSNTTPEFTNLLLGEDKYTSIDDSENGTLFVVTIIDGVPTSSRLVFNCNCPD